MNKPLRIFIDHQIFTIQNFGGISRVFTELFNRFKKKKELESEIPIIFSENEYLKDIISVKSFLTGNNSFLKKLFYYVVNRGYSTIKLIKRDFDIFIPTYYDPYFLPFLREKPFVLVLHDMTHEIFPDTVSKKDMTVKWKKELVYKADKIIAISENTKKDIVKFYGIDKDKIEVVYWGTSIVVPKEKIDIDLPKRYILFVGNRGTYKNFELFFKSVSTLLENDKDLYLVCAGSGKFNDREIDMFTNSGVLDKVIHIRFKDDEELGYIYNKALCFVFPSLYEGFGIPVLEAFACDCPAIISNTSSLPEVGGNAVEYFNPSDMDSIKKSVDRVIQDSKLRDSMRKKGRERLKEFSWDITVKKIMRIHKEIIH